MHDQAKVFGIEDDYLEEHDDHHSIIVNPLIIAKMIFPSKIYERTNAGQPLHSNFNEFKQDCIQAFGEEHLQEIITDSYIKHHKEIESHSNFHAEPSIPTTDKAFREIEQRYIKGERQIIRFDKVKFLDNDKAAYFIKKYTGLSVLGNYADYLKRSSKDLASAETFGRTYIDDHYIKNPHLTQTDAQREKLFAARDSYYGSYFLHSSQRQKTLSILSKVQSYIAMGRAVTLGLSPFADKMIGASNMMTREFQYHSNAGKVLAFANLFLKSIKETIKAPSTLAKGFAKEGDKRIHFSDVDAFFNKWISHSQYRFAYSFSGNKSQGVDRYLMNYFHHVDSGLRVANINHLFNRMRRSSHLSFDQLKEIDRPMHGILEDTLGINKTEWERIRGYVNDNEMLDVRDFSDDPTLMRKMASMEYMARLDAISTDYHATPRWLRLITNNFPKTTSVFSMFWSFFAKTMMYNWGLAQRSLPAKGLSTAAYVFGVTAIGSFVPNLVLNLMLGYTKGRQLDDILKDDSTYISASTGVLSRLYDIGAGVFYDPSSLGYLAVSSPMAGLGWKIGQSIYRSAEYGKGDHRINPYFYPLKMVINSAPLPFISPALLKLIDRHYHPRGKESLNAPSKAIEKALR